MEKTTDFSALSAKISKAFRSGVQTNLTLLGDSLRREILKGRLYSEGYGDNLFIFRDMGGFFRMYYYISGDGCPELPEKAVVTEVSFREQNAEKAVAVIGNLKNAGFREYTGRCRYTRPASPAAASSGVTVAGPGDILSASRLLDACFPSMTGCIPTTEELCEAIATGHILCTRSDIGSLTGIIHIRPGKAATELRHLAVLPGFRKKGLAQSLFQAYIEKTCGGKSRVWVRTGNSPAENFYRKNGYVPDGYRSIVLISRKDI